MTNIDSQRIKEIRDNTRAMAEAFDRIANTLAEALELYVSTQTKTQQTDKDKVVCPNCGRSDYIRSFEKDFNIKNSEYRYKCINCNTYIKDTLQTERSEE